MAIKGEENVDGVFPVLCTDKDLTAKEALVAYKYQPHLEKRFWLFKHILLAAPLLFKKIERVESMMFMLFLALIFQAVIEREDLYVAGPRGISEEHIAAFITGTGKNTAGGDVGHHGRPTV